MARADAILTAVRRIHEAPLTPTGWIRALPAIAAVSGSQRVNFQVEDAGGRPLQFIAGYGLGQDDFARFRAASDSVGPLWWQRVPTEKPSRRSTILPDREFRNSGFYNAVARPAGLFYSIDTPLMRTPERHVHLIVARAAGLDDFAPEDLAVMQMLTPHLVIALRVCERLAAADARAIGLCAALDRMDAAVILADAEAKILFANPVAEAMLAGHDGLNSHSGSLTASDPAAARSLRRLVATCADASIAGPGATIELPRAKGHAPLRVAVAPFRREGVDCDMTWLGSARPVAILIATDSEQGRRMRKEQLRCRFSLTAAEADVAFEIVRGDGREAAAARLGISMTTARTHLTHIFEKTGARRQAELVHLLLNGERAGRDSSRA